MHYVEGLKQHLPFFIAGALYFRPGVPFLDLLVSTDWLAKSMMILPDFVNMFFQGDWFTFETCFPNL